MPLILKSLCNVEINVKFFNEVFYFAIYLISLINPDLKNTPIFYLDSINNFVLGLF